MNKLRDSGIYEKLARDSGSRPPVPDPGSKYRRVPKVAAPVTFGISRPERPQLSGERYFRVAKIRR